jgi:cytochrome c oxidase subunit 2
VHLANGQTIVADEAYLRESIVNPQAKVVAGYPTIMPTFQGLIGEEGLLQLIAYIKSLTPPAAAPAGAAAPPAPSPTPERKASRP